MQSSKEFHSNIETGFVDGPSKTSKISRVNHTPHTAAAKSMQIVQQADLDKRIFLHARLSFYTAVDSTLFLPSGTDDITCSL